MNRRLIPLLLVILAVYTPCLAAQPGGPLPILETMGWLQTALVEHSTGIALAAAAVVVAAALTNLLHRS